MRYDKHATEQLFAALRHPSTELTEHDIRLRMCRAERVLLWATLVAAITVLVMWGR